MKTIKGEIVTPNKDVLHPITDMDCVFDSEGNPLDIIIDELKQYPINETLTLLAANWTDTTPSTYTVTDSRYTATVSDWDIRPGVSMTEAQTEALSNADIDIDGSHDGYFILTAKGDKPTIDLPILVKIWRL